MGNRGIITITAGLTAAEVSAAIPKTGGMMVYIEEIYGKKLGFLTGWMQNCTIFSRNDSSFRSNICKTNT